MASAAATSRRARSSNCGNKEASLAANAVPVRIPREHTTAPSNCPGYLLTTPNGKQTGEGRVEKTVPIRYSVEPFDVGLDNVSAVSEEYQSPFPFKGRIEQVKIELK
jgi:hypothetical protein